MYRNISFGELFNSEEQAVACYLSLERRYMETYQQLRKQRTETDQIIRLGYWEYQRIKPGQPFDRP